MEDQPTRHTDSLAHEQAQARALPDLPPTQAAELARDLLAEPTALPGATTVPDRRAQASEDVAGKRLGTYELVRELGRGAMGVVYLARDVGLNRQVALKVLPQGLTQDRSLLERFQREAASCARLQHENVVSVLGMGEDGGVHFYAMEFVDGESVAGLCKRDRPSPERAARIAMQAARGLGHAHENGIVHRDVKPANLMATCRRIEGTREVSKRERAALNAASTSWREKASTGAVSARLTKGASDAEAPAVLQFEDLVKVADFGLARMEGGEKLTSAGAVMGTPSYMSPEQARGDAERVGPASDVWSLGATLYEMLTGRPPFQATDLAKLLRQIWETDPIPPRQLVPGIDRDLDTIVLKCLEKDSARRYRDGRRLADDLGRWLADEPIAARPVGWLQRRWRRVRRSPLVASLSLGVALALLAAGGIAWRGWEKDREAREERQRIVESRLADLSRFGSTFVSNALGLRRAGSVEEAARSASALLHTVDELKSAAPDLAEPWHYEGLILRALGKEEAAEQAQDRAVALARRPTATGGSRAILASALYERGVLRLASWRRLRTRSGRELLRERWGGGDVVQTAPAAVSAHDVEERFPQVARARAAVADDFRAAIALLPEGDRRRSLSEGFVAYVDLRSAEHGDLLAKALRPGEYLQEAYSFQADLAEDHGDWPEALRLYEEAHVLDLGYVPHLLGLARAAGSLAIAAASRGDDSTQWFDKAVASFDGALALSPLDVDALKVKTETLWRKGEVLARSGKDPSAALEEALHTADLAQSAGLDEDSYLHQSGVIRTVRGQWRSDHHEDPTEDLRGAIACFARAQEVDAQSSTAHDLAYAHELLGTYRAAQGWDPTAEYAAALAAYERAFELDPRNAKAANGLGLLYTSMGRWKAGRREDPSADYVAAIKAYEKSIEVTPASVEPLHNKGNAWKAIADWKRSRREDALADYEESARCYEEALRRSPQSAIVAESLANTYRSLAEGKADQGKDPVPDFLQSLEMFERAVRLQPRRPDTLMKQGAAHKALGAYQHKRKEDPTKEYLAAIACYDRVLEIDPKEDDSVNNQADTERQLGDWERSQGREASEWYAKALAEYEGLVTRQPRMWQALANRGMVLERLGRDTEAVEAYMAALKIAPGQPNLQRLLDAAEKKAK